VLLTLLQSTKTTDHPLRLTSHRTNWLKYKKYVSSHIPSTPHFNIEADIDCSTDALEEVFVEAATISTPHGREVQTNHFKTNMQIERLVLEKRILRRAWQTNRSPSSKQRLKETTRTLNRALKQETEKSQLRYIKKPSATSTKHPLWRADPNLSSPIETVTPIRNSSGSCVRSDDDRAEVFALHRRNVFQPNLPLVHLSYHKSNQNLFPYHHFFRQRRSRKSLGN